MNKQYNSIYGEYIMQFIVLKKKLGYECQASQCIFSQMDRLAERLKQISPEIDKEFARKWSEKLPNESEIYRYKRVRLLAEFSTYLCDLGMSSYIPKLPKCPASTFIPHIYSPDEIDRIFKVCDELRLKRMSKDSCLLCLPALLRLLYATGLRIGEALSLKNGDVHLEDNYLQVKDQKNNKERIIPFSESLASILGEYKKYKELFNIDRANSEKFFINHSGHSPHPSSIHHRFMECLSKAGIPHIGRGQGPRVHDLRHTFAVTSLAMMSEAGIDIYASLPVLSSYLGHQSLGSTNHYVRLTTNMYPELLKDIDKVCFDVFPKIKNYETN